MNLLSQFNNINPILAVLILIWILFWKMFALWRAVKFDQKIWFAAIFLINSVGILEITYLFYFCKEPLKRKDFTIDTIKKIWR